MGYSLVAARHRGILVPLASFRTNDLAEGIVLPRLFPELRTLNREIVIGKSRLDFRLGFGEGTADLSPLWAGKKELLLEVKGCTLTEEGTAMFPDAPTLRGLKHLEELEALAEQGRPAGMLFILMNPKARRFVPNLHTDPAFTGKLIALKDRIWMRAVSVRTREDGPVRVEDPAVPIDLEAASAVIQDRGVYMLLVEVKRRRRLNVGSMGDIQFDPGWYVYVGSAKRNLEARIARHRRRRKKMHWHVDYLLAGVEYTDITAVPIRSRHDLECELARDVAKLASRSVARFGCSDCSCPSHLLRFDNKPLVSRAFLDLLLHYRHTLALL